MIHRLKNIALLCAMTLAVGACGTSDGTLREEGRSDSYVAGFHDGRHSGMSEEGNDFEHYIRDETRFQSDVDYKTGWFAGEIEGMRIQDQSNEFSEGVGAAVGGAVGGAISSGAMDDDDEPDFDKIGRDAVKNVDTTGFENLGK